jgi:nitroreductase
MRTPVWLGLVGLSGSVFGVEFSDVLRRRRMVRSFDGAGVDPELLERVVGAASRAPSAGNSHAVEVVVLTGEDVGRYWSVTLPDRSAFRWRGLFDAPVLLVVLTSPAAYVGRYAEADKASTGLGASEDSWAVPFWWVDAGMAVENVLLAAVDEGLGACFFGLFDHERAALDALGVPDVMRGVGTIALGHPAPDEPGRSAGRPRPARVHRGRWSA